MYNPPGSENDDSDAFNVQQVAGEDTVEINSPFIQIANLALWADANCATYRRFIAINPTPVVNADAFQVVSYSLNYS